MQAPEEKARARRGRSLARSTACGANRYCEPSWIMRPQLGDEGLGSEADETESGFTKDGQGQNERQVSKDAWEYVRHHMAAQYEPFRAAASDRCCDVLEFSLGEG